MTGEEQSFTKRVRKDKPVLKIFTNFKRSTSQMFFKKGVLKNFARLATLLK